MLKKMGIQFKLFIVAGSVIFVGLFILAFYSSYSSREISKSLSVTAIENLAISENMQVVNAISRKSLILEGFARTIATSLNSNYGKDYYDSMILGYLKQTDEKVIGVGVMLSAGVLGAEPYSSYVSQKPGGGYYPLEAFTEDMFQADYVTIPIKTGKNYVTGRYEFKFAENDKRELFTYSIPIMINGKAVGMLFLDINYTFLQNAIDDIKPFGVGCAYLIDGSGNILALNSGRNELLGKNIHDFDLWSNSAVLLENMHSDKTYVFNGRNTDTKEENVFVVAPVNLSSNNAWGLIVQTPIKIMTKATDNSRNIIIIISILVIIVLITIITIYSKRIIVKPIIDLSSSLRMLAEGDISWDVPLVYLNSKDEWGDIAKSVDLILKSLNKIIGEVNKSSIEIKNAANEVASGNHDLSKRTESQAASLEETSSSMEEMAAAIKSSANNSVSGNEIMVSSKNAVENAAVIIENTTKSIEEVYEASSKITAITKIIESIAFQTNILALNAAVEAARAGDQGKGFAVVASEVRNLAQTTQDSVKNISTLILDAEDKIKKATDSAKKSQELFSDIQTRIDKTAGIMKDISVTAVEQQSGVEQVNKAVIDMDMLTQQNAALVEEATAASETLKDKANTLAEMMIFFKLHSQNEHSFTKENNFSKPDPKKNYDYNKKEDKIANIKLNVSDYKDEDIKSPLKNNETGFKKESYHSISSKDEFGSAISPKTGLDDGFKEF